MEIDEEEYKRLKDREDEFLSLRAEINDALQEFFPRKEIPWVQKVLYAISKLRGDWKD